MQAITSFSSYTQTWNKALALENLNMVNSEVSGQTSLHYVLTSLCPFLCLQETHSYTQAGKTENVGIFLLLFFFFFAFLHCLDL